MENVIYSLYREFPCTELSIHMTDQCVYVYANAMKKLLENGIVTYISIIYIFRM